MNQMENLRLEVTAADLEALNWAQPSHTGTMQTVLGRSAMLYIESLGECPDFHSEASVPEQVTTTSAYIQLTYMQLSNLPQDLSTV